MGMIWNSKATIDMIDQINVEFSNDPNAKGGDGDKPPIKKWQRAANKFLFKGANELSDIASNNGFFGGGRKGSKEDQNWQTWLQALGDSNKPNSAHETLRAAIYDGLDNYNEIVFSVVPWSRSTIKVDPSSAGTVKVIQVYTPTVAAIKAAIKRRKAARKKAKV